MELQEKAILTLKENYAENHRFPVTFACDCSLSHEVSRAKMKRGVFKMRSIVLATFVLFSSLGMMAQNNTHTVLHQDGLFGLVSAVSGDTSLFLQISRGTDFFTGQPTTFLLYDTFVQSPDGSTTDTFAIGTIPNDSIKGSDPAHVVLDVDTSQLTTISTTSWHL